MQALKSIETEHKKLHSWMKTQLYSLMFALKPSAGLTLYTAILKARVWILVRPRRVPQIGVIKNGIYIKIKTSLELQKQGHFKNFNEKNKSLFFWYIAKSKKRV